MNDLTKQVFDRMLLRIRLPITIVNAFLLKCGRLRCIVDFVFVFVFVQFFCRCWSIVFACITYLIRFFCSLYAFFLHFWIFVCCHFVKMYSTSSWIVKFNAHLMLSATTFFFNSPYALPQCMCVSVCLFFLFILIGHAFINEIICNWRSTLH